MNCKTFIKKLPEFMENTMIHDMKDAMEKHMNSCEECKRAYEAEKSLDDMFVNALQIEDIKLSSARAEIMKGIDRNRYGKSPLNKVKFGLRKFRWQIASSAAILAIAFTALPFFGGMGENKNTDTGNVAMYTTEDSGPKMKSAEAAREMLPTVEEAPVQENSIAGFDAPNSAFAADSQADNEQIYQPIFEKVDLEKAIKLDFATPWKKSPEGTIEVSISGKGVNAAEEGIAELVFTNKKDGSFWKLSLLENEAKQFTPMAVEWYDNDRLLVVIGFGHGTVTAGGDLIVLDVNTGKAVNLYPVNSKDVKNQVTSAVRNGNTIEVNVRLYEDDNMVNFKEEKRILTIEEDKEGNLIIPDEKTVPQN